MDSFMALFIGLVTIVLLFGLPIVVVVSGVIIYIKRRQWIHRERLKMIESGLVTDESDFEKLSKNLGSMEGPTRFDVLFYMLMAFLGFIFLGFLLYALFFFILLKTPDNTGSHLIWMLAGIMATFLFALFAKSHAGFREHRGKLLLGCAFISLLWTNLLFSELRDLSFDMVKKSVKHNLGVSVEDFIDHHHEEKQSGPPDTLELEIQEETTEEGKLIIR